MNRTSQTHFSLLSTYFLPRWRRVALLAILLIGSIGLQLVNPLIVRYVLDTAETGTATTGLVLAAALFTLFGLIQAAASLGVSYVGEDVSWSATNDLRADLVRHCLRLDMGFHNSRTPGELIERIDGDVSELASFFSQLVLRVLANALLISGVVILLFREQWLMGMAAAVYAVLIVLVLQGVHGRNIRLWGAFREAQARLNGFLEERLSGLEDVRANGAEGYVLRGLALAQQRAFKAGYRARLFGVFIFALTHMLSVLALALGFGLGIYFYLSGQVTIGTVYLIVYYLAVLREPLEQIRDQVNELQQSTASIQRIRQLFAFEPSVKDSVTLASASAGAIAEYVVTGRTPHAPAIDFDHLSFSYTQTQLAMADGGESELAADGHDTANNLSVLHDLSFSLAPGHVLGLLGRTGSGKTTVTRLLLRLYDPDSGHILLDGQDISALPLQTLRRQVGMVTQEVQLFQASLRDNISLFDPTVDDQQILDILRELGLWAWYSALPDGLDTRLHGGGQGLSAGQAQLLAFVRVFLKNPGLAILDEASSRLDPATEALLERATDRLLQDRTGIVIAHRLRTVQRANTIMILEGGRIVEFGRRAALAADPTSRFYHLLQTGLEEALA